MVKAMVGHLFVSLLSRVTSVFGGGGLESTILENSHHPRDGDLATEAEHDGQKDDVLSDHHGYKLAFFRNNITQKGAKRCRQESRW